MGKWSQVRCNCHNRIPLPKSSWFDRPYCHSLKKLSSKKRIEVKLLGKQCRGRIRMWASHGMLVQLCPSDIIRLGLAIETVFADDFWFEIYPKVGDWHNYFSESCDEELHISPAEAELWLMESIELEQAFLNQGNISHQEVQQVINILFDAEVESNLAFKQRVESVRKIELSRIVPLLNHLNDVPRSRNSILE